MTALTAFGRPNSGRFDLAKKSTDHETLQTCAVRLIDRRTGAALRINGTPLVIYTRHPGDAVAELLDGRDAAVWDARVEPLEQEPAR